MIIAAVLLCHHSEGTGTIEENKVVTCLQRCGCFDLPGALYIKDALLSFPSSHPQDMGSGLMTL